MACRSLLILDLATGRGDCKALATLADALLQRTGIDAHVILLSSSSIPPLSFNVPDALWSPLHVILYIPVLDAYVDPTRMAARGVDWKTSAETYRGAIALDTATGYFVVVH